MIETDHLEAAIAGGAARVDVILGIDQKPVCALGKIAGPNGLDNLTLLAEQDPAAFRGPRTEGVGDDRLENPGAYGATFSLQHSAISFQQSGNQQSAFSIQHSAFSNQLSACSTRPLPFRE
jgi:hypothetical protein